MHKHCTMDVKSLVNEQDFVHVSKVEHVFTVLFSGYSLYCSAWVTTRNCQKGCKSMELAIARLEEQFPLATF